MIVALFGGELPRGVPPLYPRFQGLDKRTMKKGNKRTPFPY